jgi:septum site-determining protein MinC
MHELHAGDRPWQPEAAGRWVALGRSLDARQLGAIAEALHESQVRLASIVTDCPETAIAAIQAGYQVDYAPASTPASAPTAAAVAPEPLYLDRSVRSGVEIRYPGAVVVCGDINPGGAVVADGDILVWGRLRGVAHAGANGNTEACIMALQLEATQVRVADRLARVPVAEGPPLPEVAYIGDQGIRISAATDFAKTRLQLRIGDLPTI